MGSRLLLALDETDPQRAFFVAEAAAPHLAGIKINWPLLMQGGLETVAKLAKLAPVICDLKVADIPNTARLIAEAAYGAGAAGIIAHAFPGAGPLRAIRDVAPDRDLYAVITMSHPGGGEFFDIAALAAVARDDPVRDKSRWCGCCCGRGSAAPAAGRHQPCRPAARKCAAGHAAALASQEYPGCGGQQCRGRPAELCALSPASRFCGWRRR